MERESAAQHGRGGWCDTTDGLGGEMARRRRPATARSGGRPGDSAAWDGETVGGDFDLTPAIEAAIDRLARAARDDPAARNELYAALELKIARFLAPYRRRRTPVGEFAELEQEAFLVFAGLVADWTGAGSFARYFLGFFPWRLRHVIEAHARRWPRDRIVLLPGDELLDLDEGLFPEIDPALQFGPLGAEDRLLLVLRLMEGWSLTEIAPRLGWSRRTTFRRWRALLARLERELAAGAERAS